MVANVTASATSGRIALMVLCGAAWLAAAQPASFDTSRIGPGIGATIPTLSGVDQTGRAHTLDSLAGPKGTMLVFFRSADW